MTKAAAQRIMPAAMRGVSQKMDDANGGDPGEQFRRPAGAAANGIARS
jgi:hypothetical protein